MCFLVSNEWRAESRYPAQLVDLTQYERQEHSNLSCLEGHVGPIVVRILARAPIGERQQMEDAIILEFSNMPCHKRFDISNDETPLL